MVIDSSALIAILLSEPEREMFIRSIADAESKIISAANFFEAGILMRARLGDGGTHDLDRFVERTGIDIAPFDAAQAVIARDACRRYGKGNHRAGLNFGDCFAYALSKASGEPLLFKGNDFARTDIEPAA